MRCGLTIFIRQLSNKGEIKGILVHDNRDRARPVTYIAEKGILVPMLHLGLPDKFVDQGDFVRQVRSDVKEIFEQANRLKDMV